MFDQLKTRSTTLSFLLCILALVGCAKIAVEGGEKPIHIVMDINVKIDRELDQFFAFEQQPATRPTTVPVADSQ